MRLRHFPHSAGKYGGLLWTGRAGAVAAAITIWVLVPAARVAVSAGAGAGQTRSRPQPATPQPPQAPRAQEEPQRPTFRTEANYVRVDVYPLVEGRPVADLTKDDFEVFEDGTPQRIEQFEFVRVQAHVPETAVQEPQTVAEAREMARETRGRIFVLFLDTYHTDVFGSHRMRTALASLLTRVLGPDDMVGVMTPEMSATDVTLARRTGSIDAMLERYWNWGRRDRLNGLDPEEEAYQVCYPTDRAPVTNTPWDVRGKEGSEQATGVAQEMIERRREKLTLDALSDLVVWLRDVREERKAVLAVSNGWRLFGPNRGLANAGSRRPPRSGVGVDPTGRIATDLRRDGLSDPIAKCEADRLYLSELDNQEYFQRLLDRANRSNVSFYPVDPRGLPVFDTSIAGTANQPAGTMQGPPPIAVDQARLRHRLESLETLAQATDGVAVTGNNDIERGLTRIVTDLSSYYLIGYYSTNTKLDGKFRAIKVRVRRAGVEVRARRGYLAPTEKEMADASRPPPATTAPTVAVERALGGLATLRPGIRVQTQVAWLAGMTAEGSAAGRVWAVAEIDRNVARSREWTGGARVEATLGGDADARGGSATVDIAPGQRTASLQLYDLDLAAGDWLLRLRITPTSGGLPFVEAVRFTVPETAVLVGAPRLSRRGPTTGLQFSPTAEAAFRRNEWIRLELPLAAEPASMTAELLDRTGKVVPVPVATRMSRAGDVTWGVAELALAPLAAGDYVVRVSVEIAAASHETLTAFRLVP